MTVGQYLQQASRALVSAGVQSARLDVLILLEDILGNNRANLLAHPELPLSDAQLAVMEQATSKRKNHTPLAYIRGKTEFYGRDFTVDEHVLVPRPETESIIELLKSLDLPAGSHILDLGCGSGCIGVTAALEQPNLTVTLSDIDPGAIAIAHKNALTHNVSVQFAQANLLNGLTEQFECILANLPYVPDAYPINQAAKHEPKLALFAGPDGLDLYRQLFAANADQAHKPKYIITESLARQHQPLDSIAKTAGYALRQTDGLAQLFVRQD